METGAFKLPAPPEKVPALRSRVGKKIVLGIRPENIHARRFMPPDINASFLEAEIEVTELMGSEITLHLTAGEQQFQARVDPRTEARPGQRIEIAFDVDRLHMFDAETEEAIGMPAAEERQEATAATQTVGE
jgi:multiple sugar transport system ATP-binding protein